MTFPSDALCGSFLFSFSRKPDDFFCQPTTKSPYFAPPGPAENQSQSSNLVFSSARDAREEEKINQRVVRDLRDFKMTTSDSYEPNHHTSSSRPCCSEAIVTQSSEPVCASIGEMANAPLLTAHTEKKLFLYVRETNRGFAAASSSSSTCTFLPLPNCDFFLQSQKISPNQFADLFIENLALPFDSVDSLSHTRTRRHRRKNTPSKTIPSRGKLRRRNRTLPQVRRGVGCTLPRIRCSFFAESAKNGDGGG